jgi:uncharacterized protein (TIGR04255 family)
MPEPVLRNSPLSTVVCELRFDAPPLQAAQIVQLGEELSAVGLTAYGAEQGLQIQLGPGQLQPQPMQRHRFADPGGSSAFTLDVNAFTYETAAYGGIDAFLETWETLARAVQPALDLHARTRLGLRYVNDVELSSGDREIVAQSVNEALLPPWGAAEHLQQLAVSLHELRFVQEEGELAFRHGVQRRAQTAPPVYLLDFDHYEQRLRAFDVAGETERLRRFNATVYDVFRWSITEDQYLAFGPEERPDA